MDSWNIIKFDKLIAGEELRGIEVGLSMFGGPRTWNDSSIQRPFDRINKTIQI